MGELRAYLWLVVALGAASTRIHQFLDHYGSPETVRKIVQDETSKEFQILTDSVKRRVKRTTEETIDGILERCEKENISLVCWEDETYPSLLRGIVNPPVVLFYRGNIELLNSRLLITVVGTRKASEYCIRCEKHIVTDLVRVGIVPVTGFAVGVDITANLCALEQGCPSVAVMGCGLDRNYPQAHFQLKNRIVEKGLILSEFLPGTEPTPSNFPIRNRILSGISAGTFVVQAPSKSGSLITARLALEQGRDVYCLPPADVEDSQYQGVIPYLRDGAIPVFDARDIVDTNYMYRAAMISNQMLHAVTGTVEPKEKVEKPGKSKKSETAVENQESVEEKMQEQESAEIYDASADTLDLEGNNLLVYQLLKTNRVMHMDAIAEQLELPMDELTMALTELELYGYIERLPGKQFRVL